MEFSPDSGQVELLDEDAGGSGLGLVDGALLFEQLGSHLVPGPVLWTVLAAPLVDGTANRAHLVGGVDTSAVESGSVVVEHAADLDALLVVADDAVVVHRTTDLDAPEPLAPLAPRASAAVGVLLVEQHVRQALAYADRVHVMERGGVSLSGPVADVRAQIERSRPPTCRPRPRPPIHRGE